MALLELGSEPTLRNILLLDKSIDPLPAQIDEACDILGISLSHDESGVQAAQKAPGSYGPREEWALGWLLKKLEGAGSDPQSPCLELRLWQLINELLHRLPVANLARLLRTYHFMDTLLKALRSLKNIFPEIGASIQQESQSLIDGISRESSAGAGSSSVTVDENVDLQKKGQKRKRDGAPIKHHPKIQKSDRDIRLLYGSVCGVVKQVQELSMDTSHGYAVEYLKKALEAPPEQAAEILGASLTLTDYMLRTDAEIRSLGDKDLIHRYIDPWVNIWKSRTSRTVKTDQESLFSKASFLPTLELLATLNDSTIHASSAETEIHVLETLILQHIVFPSREIFEKSKRHRTSQEDGGPRLDIDQLLMPVQDSVSHGEKIEHSGPGRFHPVAKFYDIVLKHTRLSTQKQRLSESAWLEFLFDRLAFQEAHPITADAHQSAIKSDASYAVKDLLDMLAEKKLKLQIPTLEKVLSQYSHILEGDRSHMDWGIIGACLSINPDVFVIPTISKDPSGQRLRAPNEYLSALFARINEISSSFDTGSEASRKVIQEIVLVSLVKGFTQARDLLSFIEHWKSNLMLTVRVANGPGKPLDSNHSNRNPVAEAQNGPNVWENEDLLQEVAAQFRQRITIGQLQAILKEMSTTFIPVHTTQAAEQLRSTASELVILDCILSGCRTEDTIRQLTDTIKDLYQTLLASCEASALPHSHSWRAWRCISTIKSRWKAELHSSLEIQEMEGRLAGKALSFIAQTDKSCLVEDMLQSLNFVLSVIETSATSTQRQELASSIIQAVMDGLKSSDELLKLDISKLLCLRPSALQNATSELQKSFFENSFECSLGGFAESESDSTHLIHDSNVAVWQHFIRLQILEEDNALARNFRNFQIDSLLAVKANYTDMPSQKDEAAYISAFDSIHRTPLRAFNRKQRSKIFNRVVERLLQNKPFPLQLFKDHLKLLTNYLSYPNNSMILIRDTFNLAPDSQERQCPQAGLLPVAKSLSDTFSSPYLDTEMVHLVEQIVQKVLGSQLSKSMDESALIGLRSYLEDLEPAKRLAGDIEILDLVLMGVSLDFYRTHLGDFPEALQRHLENLPALCMDFSKIVIKYIYNSCTTATRSDFQQAAIAAGSLVRFTDILYNSPELPFLSANLEQLSRSALEHKHEHSDPDKPYVEQELAAIGRLQRRLGKLDIPGLLNICRKDAGVVSIREQRSFVSQTLGSVVDIGFKERASIVTSLLSETTGNTLNRNTLLVFQRLIISRADTGTSISEEFLIALANVINYLCEALLQPLPFQVSVLSLQVVNSILQKYPRIITQWHIDQIMAVITTRASRLLSSNLYTPKQNGLFFLGLCRVFSTILAFHRTRLGGRYHLILPALQSLLRPLFIPFTATRADTSNASETDNSSPYTSAHASAYSRLLLQIADPSLPSVKGHDRSNKESLNLNDATKTAKSIAGQHLHYLVMTYCECQLKGRLEKEVREQLKPGLWAMLDVIPQEVMRVMNSAMGKEGRGVWKAVYSEWRREGGGRGR